MRLFSSTLFVCQEPGIHPIVVSAEWKRKRFGKRRLPFPPPSRARKQRNPGPIATPTVLRNAWQDQRSNPIQSKRNLRLENTWLAVLSSSSRASTGQERPHKRSFSPSGSPPKPCPSSGASSQVSTPEESPPKETQKKSGGTSSHVTFHEKTPRERAARRAPLTTPRSHNGHRPSHRRLSARLLRPRRPRDPPALLRKPLGSRRLARGGPEPRHPRPLRPLRLFRRRVLRRQGPPAPLVPRPRRRPPRARSRPLSRSRARGRGRAGWLRGGALREGGAAGPRAHDL